MYRYHYRVLRGLADALTSCVTREFGCFSGNDALDRLDVLRDDRRYLHLQVHVGSHHVVQAHHHLALVPEAGCQELEVV